MAGVVRGASIILVGVAALAASEVVCSYPMELVLVTLGVILGALTISVGTLGTVLGASIISEAGVALGAIIALAEVGVTLIMAVAGVVLTADASLLITLPLA